MSRRAHRGSKASAQARRSWSGADPLRKFRDDLQSLPAAILEGADIARAMLCRLAKRTPIHVDDVTFAVFADGVDLPMTNSWGIPGRPWNFGVIQGRLPPEPRGKEAPPSHTIVAILGPSDSCFSLSFPPELILPPSDAPIVGVRRYLWSIYSNRDLPDNASGDADLVTHLLRQIDLAAVEELALPGAKRPMLELVFDVGCGAEIERQLGAGIDPAEHLATVQAIWRSSLTRPR